MHRLLINMVNCECHFFKWNDFDGIFNGNVRKYKKTIKIMYIIRDVVFVHLTLKSKP